MIDKISNWILDKVASIDKSEEEKEILLFGITRIVEDIPKAIGIILISILLGVLKEVTIVTIILILYKTMTGGVHAKTNWGCFFYSLLFYLAIVYTARFLVLTGIDKFGVYTIIYIFCMYTIFVYVPADVPEIPKVNAKLRKDLKIKAIIILNVVYIVALVIIKDVLIQNLIIYSTFYISLMTTRTIYRLFRNEYGYETYIPDELI